MKLILTHFIFQARILLRTPAFLIPTLIFPAMLYCFLGGTGVVHGEATKYLLGSMTVYGVLGVGIYQFSAAIAGERESPFYPWTKTLRGALLPMLIARIMIALCFAIIAVSLLLLAAHVVTEINLNTTQLIKLMGISLIAMVPSILIGMAIGNLCSAKVSIAIANLIFLPLSFLGGLLINANSFSSFMTSLSNLTITRHLGELSWAIVGNHPMPNESWFVVAIYTAALAALVWFAVKRDQNKRFG
jgi:ABC-2 type transport system permease protein